MAWRRRENAYNVTDSAELDDDFKYGWNFVTHHQKDINKQEQAIYKSAEQIFFLLINLGFKLKFKLNFIHIYVIRRHNLSIWITIGVGLSSIS